MLAVSVSWKFAISSDREDRTKDIIVNFLTSNHFEVSSTDQIANSFPVLRATSHSCTLQIVRLAPNGADRDLFRHISLGADRTFVVFRGKIYAQQPIWWTLLDDIWSRHLREIGLSKRVAAVFGIAASSFARPSNCRGMNYTKFPRRRWLEVEQIRPLTLFVRELDWASVEWLPAIRCEFRRRCPS